MKEKVLILGAGYAGSVVANKLAREFRKKIAKDELDITILDKSDTSINQGGFTFLPFGLYTPEDIIRKRKKLISPRVNTAFGDGGEVTSVDLNNKEVTVKNGNKYSYNYLVIAMGARADADTVPGLANDLNTFYTSIDGAMQVGEKLRNLEKGNIVISVASMPIPCPGAPVKFTFLLDSYLRNIRKNREQFNLTLLWPMEPIGPPEFNKLVSGLLKEKNIEVKRSFPLGQVDASKKELTSKEGEKVDYDLLIAVPPHKPQKVLVDSGITDEKGWVPCDRTTLQYRGPAGNHDNVYILGDNGPADILKTGIGAHYQALVVTQNIINEIYGNKIKVPYEGETGCPIITEMETPSSAGEAYIATWNYGVMPAPFKPTKMGWYMYRMYYYLHWDMSVKGLF
jgi:NADH dehydrogenase, FAD-containing subunit